MSKAQTIADKVREASKANPDKTAADIAALLGTKRSYVHTVWYMDRKKGRKTSRRVGRPPKTVQERTSAIDVIKPLNTIVADDRVKRLEDQIQDLMVVIRYLEGRLYGASV